MIFFHLFYDLNYFGIIYIKMHSYPLFYFFLPFPVIFFLLVGISLTLSYNRVKNKLDSSLILKKFAFRSLKIFSLAIIITIVSYFYLKDGFILFGVLHFIALSIILAYPFIKQKSSVLFFGIIIIIFGIFLYNYTFHFNFLLWLGFTPYGFYTLDYYPLLPWFGFILIGIFIGNRFYTDYKRRFNLSDFSDIRVIKFLSFLGKKSLLIYFLHQPIIVGIIYLYLLI